MTSTYSRPSRRLSLVGTDLDVADDAAPASYVAEAACASPRAVGIPPSAWTPEVEADAVPATLMAICETCPVWSSCLREALRLNDVGYRASTTTSQRRRMFPELGGEPAIGHGPRLDVDDERRPRHPRGEGSLSRYRRGCRCDECRGHNAAARRRERARAS